MNYSENVPSGLAFAIPSMEAHRCATVTQQKSDKESALKDPSDLRDVLRGIEE